MNRNQNILIIILLVSIIIPCNSQNNDDKSKKHQTSHNIIPTFYFKSNTLKLTKESKMSLKYLGKKLSEKGFDKTKYQFYLQVIENSNEIKKDRFIYAKRAILILDFLEKKYMIPNDIFYIEYVEKTPHAGYIGFAMHHK